MKRKQLFTIFLVLTSIFTLAGVCLAQEAYMTAAFKTQGKLKGKGPGGAVELVATHLNPIPYKKSHAEKFMIVTYADSAAGKAHEQLTRAENTKELATTVTVSLFETRTMGQAKGSEQIIMTNATFSALPSLDGNTRAKITFAKFEIRYSQQKSGSNSKGGYNTRH